MCADGWDYGEPDGGCPECGAETVEGSAATGCNHSEVCCEVCGDAPCDLSC